MMGRFAIRFAPRMAMPQAQLVRATVAVQ
eukprot:COSAG06_NODE_17762_length_922_cov_7.099635_1_plen_28_part_10